MRQFSFKAFHIFASILGLACLANTSNAAISVGPDGAGPLTFDTAPGNGDFLSGYFGGTGASFANPGTVDTAVNGLAAAVFTPDFVLATSATLPPSAYPYSFRYNTAGFFLQSRPTTGAAPDTSAAIVMLATLQNDSGTDQSGIVVNYDFGVTSPATGELPGFRVYFSVTGEAGTWVLIPELSDIETAGPVTATLNLGTWATGSPMFLMWFDDNSNGVTDPGYTIDNFAIALGSGPKMPVTIVAQTNLTDRTLSERQGLTYSISATGSPIQYQWFHDGVPIENSTNCVNGNDRIIIGARTPTLRINHVEPLDGGDYHCVVSNSLGSESSDVATLTVLADTNAPTILYVYPGSNPNEIIVVFSEPLNDSCLGVGGGGAVSDAANWTVEDVGGSALGVAGFTNLVDLRNQTTIGLVTSFPHDPTLPFRVTIGSAFSDTSVAQNVLAQGTSRLMTPLVTLDQLWSFNDQDIDPGPNWFASDPGGNFPTGPGPFDAKRDGGVFHANGLDDCRAATLYGLGNVGSCLSLQSPVTQTNLITAYFWTHFDFSGDAANSDLFLIGKADDGAVVYLNGSEVQRLRMAAAPTEITHTTFSQGTVADTDPQDRIVIGQPQSLQSGDNLLAISLHQSAPNSSDLTLGFQIYAVEPASTVRVRITFSGGNPVISWTPSGGRLEFKQNVSDATWTELSTSNPFTDTSGQQKRFYRVFLP